MLNFFLSEGKVMLKFLNLKEEGFTVEYALAVTEIEIESAKREGIVAIKVLHGYGSHGRGGVIAMELKKRLQVWKRSGFIVDYFGGDRWNIFDNLTKRILELDKSIYNDEDINKSNPGITIIQVIK